MSYRALAIFLDQTVKMQSAHFTPNFPWGITNDHSQTSKPNDPQNDSLPPIGEQVLVQAGGFRCLAFRHQDGKWRNAFGRGELPGIIRVIKSD
jgi:hypothetical protein